MADDLAAVIGHFDLHEATLVAHSLDSKEAVRYLTRHGESRIARLVLIGPVTPLLRRTGDNPGGLDPALIDANYAAVAADVPKWCADFEAAGPYFGSSPGASPGLVDWTIRMIVDTPLPVLLATLKVNADVDRPTSTTCTNGSPPPAGPARCPAPGGSGACRWGT
jgi:non-heme chloroperoxidase